MIIDCQSCSNRYAIPDEIVGRRPRSFSCVGCGESWTVWAAPMLTEATPPLLSDPGLRSPKKRRARAVAVGGRMKSISARIAPALGLVALMAATSIAIGSRAAIVSTAPATAVAYAELGIPVNLRGLAIDSVRATVTPDSDDGRALLVMGEIVNLRGSQTAAPDLRIALRADDGQELYAWTLNAPKRRFAPGERVAFKARLASPPSGVHDVLVKFRAAGDKGRFTETRL